MSRVEGELVEGEDMAKRNLGWCGHVNACIPNIRGGKEGGGGGGWGVIVFKVVKRELCGY